MDPSGQGGLQRWEASCGQRSKSKQQVSQVQILTPAASARLMQGSRSALLIINLTLHECLPPSIYKTLQEFPKTAAYVLVLKNALKLDPEGL